MARLNSQVPLPKIMGYKPRSSRVVFLNKCAATYSARSNAGMVNITHEYKLNPTLEQEAVIEDWLEICRKVYNYALAERKDWVRSRKCPINACRIDREYIVPVDAKRPTFASQCQS